MTEPAAPPPLLPPPAAPVPRPAWQSPWLALAVVIGGLLAWQVVETRLRLAETQQEVARRLAESAQADQENRALATQARDQLAALQGKIGTLESRLAEAQGQQAALETLYQELARSRDDSALFEIEQGITLAAQQLQLAGNTQAAVLALQTADARLAGASRPQFIPLRKAIGRDLERLRALPLVDLPGMSVRLEGALAAIDTLPLAVDVRPAPAAPAREEAGAPRYDELETWRRMARDFWQEVRTLVRIQRFDRDEPPLLAPGQSFFLRENLKLRLLNARLALLSRDQRTFRSELKAADQWLARHFDTRDAAVQAARDTLSELGVRAIDIELPTLNESLSAIKQFSAGRDKR